MSGIILRCNGCGASLTHAETCEVAPLAFVDGQLKAEIEALRNEVRKFQARLIEIEPDAHNAECAELCEVVCAGPCEGRDVGPLEATQ